MKRYPHIISKLLYEPVAITPSKHAAIMRVIESHLARGIRLDDPHEPPGSGGAPIVEPEEPEPDWQTFGPDAIIPVHGVLGKHLEPLEMMSGGCDLDTVSAMIDVAMADSEVQKIIFDFRTPGGEVTGIPELGRKIAGITSKKTIAFTDSECCSGGVWLATQCQYFYTTSSAAVGSIGVWTAYLDISRQMANEGENMQAVFAGKFKLMGAYWRPLSDDERARLQADVDKIYSQFTEAVNLRREVAADNMQGQIFDGEQAVEIGLCDGLVEGMDELLQEETEESKA